MNTQILKAHENNVKKNIIKMVHAAGSGHPGGSLSGTSVLTYLFFEGMNFSKDNADSNKRDRFVLSKGHASPLLYAILAEKGVLTQEQLLTFRQVDSIMQGHPNMEYVPGVDMSTGSLGQGISCAVGMALANKLDNSEHRVYALLGDGECQEGQVWEALMSAAHYKLNNLCAVLDYNGLQIDGNITDVLNPEPFDSKFASFGWNVVVIDGHDFTQIEDAFNQAKACEDKPTMIIAKTIKGHGVSYMENNAGWHGNAPGDDLYAQAMKDLGGE